MRRWVTLFAVGAVLCVGGQARAQFANKSIGLQVGFLSLSGVGGDELDYGFPIGLTGSLYIENGFDVVAHIGVMVVHDKILSSNVLGLDGPAVGVRYLFLEEGIRPYVGLDLSYLQIFGSQLLTTAFAGIGPNAGIDFFISDSVSIGLRVRFNVYISLNAVWYSPAVNLAASTYF